MTSTIQAFCTALQQEKQQQTKLRNYVNNLQSKIQYAKWKQSLVLTYNYMPLKTIKDKIDTQRINYEKKIKQEQQRCMQILQRNDFNQQLLLFRQFSSKLEAKVKKLQIAINDKIFDNTLLHAQIKDKKDYIQMLNRSNKKVQTSILQENGIKTKTDIVRLIRSRTQKRNLTNNNNYQTNNTRTNTLKKQSKFQQYQQYTTKMLYNQCLNQVINSIKVMKSSQDIQTGIYLDIMNKKQLSKTCKFSLKSKICDTLMEKYSGRTKTRQENLSKNDFDMSWETFNKLNWKQIMGIVLVKDRNCNCLKNLLTYKN